MSCTLSVFAVDAVVWASKSAWHATYEDMLVLERRHSSDVLGLDSVHLLYPRVRRRWLRGRKMRVPLRLRSVRHFRHIQAVSTRLRNYKTGSGVFLQRDHKRNVSMYAALTYSYWAVAN